MKPIIVIDTETFDEAIKINKRDLIPLHLNKNEGEICSSGHTAMAEIRTIGPLKDSAIWLSANYNWHLGKDTDGSTVIIPVRKS